MAKGKETHTGNIINKFILAQAVSENTAINQTEIKVDFEENEKKYLIDSLISSGYLVETSEEKIWFDQIKWKNSIRKLTLQYSLIMATPILIAAILYFVFF